MGTKKLPTRDEAPWLYDDGLWRQHIREILRGDGRCNCFSDWRYRQLCAGLDDARNGRIRYLGSFAKYADD